MNTDRPCAPRNAAHTHANGAYGGDPQVELLSRMRRMETRLMNLSRSMGMLPGMHQPDPRNPVAVVNGNDIIVTSPSVSIGDILATGVIALDGKTAWMNVVLMNQTVATVLIQGRDLQAGEQ